MQGIFNSGLTLAVVFPPLMHFSEFVLVVAAQFQKDSRTMKNDDGTIVIKLDIDYFKDLLKCPDVEEYAKNSPESCLEH